MLVSCSLPLTLSHHVTWLLSPSPVNLSPYTNSQSGPSFLSAASWQRWDWLQCEFCHGPTWHGRRRYQKWNNGTHSHLETVRGDGVVGGVGLDLLIWPKFFLGHWLNHIFSGRASWREQDKAYTGWTLWVCEWVWKRKSDVFLFRNASHHPQTFSHGKSVISSLILRVF